MSAGRAPHRPLRILLAGESWSSYGINVKGFNAYYTGFYDEGHQPLTEALGSAGHDVTYLPNHLAATEFPRTVEALDAWDVVILSDLGSDTLLLHPDTFRRSRPTPNPLVALRDWVVGGGGLLMIGGYMSFSGYGGAARYGMTPLADVLPVTLLGQDDRVETPEGVRPEPTSNDPDGVLASIEGPWPPLLGYNRLIARADATVLLRRDDDPFLTVARMGRGRSAAFASDCSPHWGSPDFIAWPHYGRFWCQLVDWLAAGD